jgi:hypothetical protein
MRIQNVHTGKMGNNGEGAVLEGKQACFSGHKIQPRSLAFSLGTISYNSAIWQAVNIALL